MRVLAVSQRCRGDATRERALLCVAYDTVVVRIYDLITYLATHPTVGDEIVGTGGVRKVRYGASENEQAW
jgi:hypothetical protein